MPTHLPTLFAKLCGPCGGGEISSNVMELDGLGDSHPPSIVSTTEKPRAGSIAPTKRRPIFGLLRAKNRLPGSSSDRELNPSYKHNLDIPFNRLPLELILDIFSKTCHSDYDRYLWDKERRKKTTPLTLGSVCAHWRDIIWTTPSMWGHIYLSLSTKRYAKQLKLLGSWIERSGDVPLLLNLVLTKEDDWDAKRVPNDLIDAIVTHASRWRVISWVLPEAWYPRLNGIRGHLANLSSICTQPTFKDADQSPTLRVRLIFLDDAPKLERVHLNGYYLTDVPLRWDQLTQLTLQQVYIDECYYAFQRSPNLVKCKISKLLVNDVARTVEAPPSKLVMEKMKKFILHAGAWNDAIHLLEHALIPGVETVDLSGTNGECPVAELSAALLGPTRGLGLKGVLQPTSGITQLILHELNLSPQQELERFQGLKDLLIQLTSLEVLDIEVKGIGHEMVRFCIWWFIDLLRAHPLGDDLDGCTSQADPTSTSTTKCHPDPNDVFFHLPSLRQFTFSVPALFSHNSFEVKNHCSTGKDEDHLFMEALLHLLKQRASKSSPYQQRSSSGSDIESGKSIAPLKARLQDFSLKSPSLLTHPEADPFRAHFDELKREQLRFKFEVGSPVWNISF